MRWNLLHFIVIILIAVPTKGATLQELAHSKAWLRLLHYKDNFPLSGYKSKVDGDGFFLAEDGNTDPEAELHADLEAFASKDIQVGKFKQHAQCAFPVRYRFLKEKLALTTQDVPCPRYEEFVTRIRPFATVVVFSTAYPNSPASMFGHIFLKIKSQPDPKASNPNTDLNDFGISYAAAVSDDENGFAFVWFGLTGGYIGQFSLLPYYAKVNEYTNSESRDIWEYELNFSPEETLRLVSHLWEIESNSYFAYYFFHENCAYQLLAALEAIKPDWRLTDSLPTEIPSESMKKIAHAKGAIRQVRYRPSYRQKLARQYRLLSGPQQQELRELLSSTDVSSRDPVVLDAATARLFYEQQKSGALSKSQAVILRKSLLARSRLADAPVTATDATSTENEHLTRPDIGHYSYRFGLSGGTQTIQDVGFVDLSFKFAYHDLLNDDRGFSRFSQVDFPGADLRYYPSDGRINLEEIRFLEITSLFPFNAFEKRISWRFQFNYASPKDYGCRTCHVLRSEGGIGASTEVLSQNSLVYLLGMVQAELGSSFRLGYRWGPKLQLGWLFNPWPTYKLHLATAAVFDLFQSDRQKLWYDAQFNQSLSLGPSWEIRVQLRYLLSTASGAENDTELKGTLNYYF